LIKMIAYSIIFQKLISEKFACSIKFT